MSKEDVCVQHTIDSQDMAMAMNSVLQDVVMTANLNGVNRV